MDKDATGSYALTAGKSYAITLSTQLRCNFLSRAGDGSGTTRSRPVPCKKSLNPYRPVPDFRKAEPDPSRPVSKPSNPG